MQPSDQDELRRRAQEAMKRRIDTTARRQEEPERPQRRQQAGGQRRSQQEARDARQLRELQQRRERERQRQQDVPEPTPEIERIEVLDTTEEPMARTERRDLSQETTTPELGEDIHEGVHERTHRGVHRDVHAGAYRRTDLQMQRGRINQDLRDRDAVRRAFVMMEVLGKPVALREQDGPSSPTTG